MSGPVKLNTNLAELPVTVRLQLSNSLNHNELWRRIVDQDPRSIYGLSSAELEKLSGERNVSSALLRHWGNRGQTVRDLLVRLQALAKVHAHCMDVPQLVLRRKFAPLIWSRSEQVSVSSLPDSEEAILQLVCHAKGFPSPHFQWISDDRSIDGESGNVLLIPRCSCSLQNSIKCRVWNEIEEGSEYSNFYRTPGKVYYSELVSNVVDVNPYITNSDAACERCKRQQMERLRRIVEGEDEILSARRPEEEDEELFASDKVALIISNCNYDYLPSLITPHCDAETLAQIVQELRFKTVTLGDLNLEEMKLMIKEYKKLLGDGVYAIFYFVGHGFEVNGQCYLLPVDAPAEDCTPECCLSMDWVLSVFQDHTPSLNLILLDICRKFLPCNVAAFVGYAEQFRRNVRVCRNTVYGYATSGGVSAYEVRGENNGIFMKYLKNHLGAPISVVEMLSRVFRDIDADKKVCDVQIPELRSNLSQPRGISDPLVFSGHTTSYEYHTIHWRYMHELPNPVHVPFPSHRLLVTIWFDFVGHFTNKVYVFSSVGDMRDTEEDEDRPPSELALSHLAHLRFAEELDAANEKIFTDDEEGVSLCLMLSNLQQSNGELKCTVELKHKDNDSEVVDSADALLGHVLITRIFSA